MNVTPRRRTAFPVKVAKNTCFMLTLTRHEIHHAHTHETGIFLPLLREKRCDVVALRSCQRDVTHHYKQIQNGGSETM